MGYYSSDFDDYDNSKGKKHIGGGINNLNL